MSTGHVPTVVDVDLVGEGSIRIRNGSVTRSMAMRMDYLTTANAAIRDFNEASMIASKADTDYDGFSTMDVGFRILGSRLNDIAIRASELEDPVLLAVLKSIGMVKDGTISLIQMGDGDSPSVLMPGLCPSQEDPSESARADIAAAVRRGQHHHDDWTLAMRADQTRDEAVLEWIADSIENGSIDSTSCPRSFVGEWRLHVRAAS